ncbi:MAG: HEAT repeat domain-containing protein, partial [Planctomycetaceae bacterium]|nr:HEAT repeat domain-containing protein [Planctomycetaceae bacterium]
MFAGACRLSLLNKHRKKPEVFVFIQLSRVPSTLGLGLGRDATSSFEFTEDEVTDRTEDDQLLETWNKSRLIGLTNDFGPTFAFLHATLHEYLAGKELLRRVDDGDAVIQRVGVDARWLQPLVLAAGAIPPTHKLWPAVSSLFDLGDQFGLLAVRMAPLLAESGVSDGGVSLVGRDIRQDLWRGILQSPDPRPYIDALIELDTDFAIDTAKQIKRLDPDDFARVMVLYTRMDPNHQRRTELVRLVAENFQPGKTAVTTSNYDLTEIMSFRPDEPLSLTGAGDYRTATEMLHSLSETEDPGRQRSILMRLARSGTSAAEQELIARFNETDDPGQLDDLFDALRALGTFGVRDTLLSWLERRPNHEPHLIKGLQILRQFPIPGSAAMLLSLLHPENTRTVRVHAALALGGSQNDDVIERLSQYAHMEFEPDVEVRKATFEALARAGAVGLVRQLHREPQGSRSDRSERLVVCGYLAAIARTISPNMDPSKSLPRIESLFLHILQYEDVAPLEIRNAAALKYSTAILDALKSLLHRSRAPEVRAAACQALRELRDRSAVEQIELVLKDAISADSPPEEKVVEEAALTLAFLDADRIKGIEHPRINTALWRYCLSTDKLMLVHAPTAADGFTDQKSDGMLVPDLPKPLIGESPDQLKDVLQQLLNQLRQPMAGSKSGGGEGNKRQREEMIELLLSKDPLMESPDVASRVGCAPATVRKSLAWTKRKELRKRFGRGGRISEESAAFELSQSASEGCSEFGSMIDEYLGDGSLSLDTFLQRMQAGEITPKEGKQYLKSLERMIHEGLSKMPENDRQYDTFILVADKVNSLLSSPDLL